MKKPTPTDKLLSRMRARREILLAEVATIDRTLAAAEGRAPPVSIVVGPVAAPVAKPAATPFYPALPQPMPYYPPPGILPGYVPAHPAFPFGQIVCGGGGIDVPMNGDARLGVPLDMSGNGFSLNPVCGGGIPPYSPINGTFTLDGPTLTTRGPVTVAAGSH